MTQVIGETQRILLPGFDYAAGDLGMGQNLATRGPRVLLHVSIYQGSVLAADFLGSHGHLCDVFFGPWKTVSCLASGCTGARHLQSRRKTCRGGGEGSG